MPQKINTNKSKKKKKKNFSPESFFFSTFLTEFFLGSSLVSRWLVVGAFSTRAQVQSLVRELRACRLRGTAKK